MCPVPALSPGGRSSGRDVSLRTADGVPLSGLLLPALPGLPRSPEVPGVPPEAAQVGVVVVHGLGMAARRPEVLAPAERLRAVGPVLVLDARGHGRSGGASTLGLLEPLDVDAAVARLRDLGCAAVVTVGFSMGATAVVRHAALGPRPTVSGGVGPLRGAGGGAAAPPQVEGHLLRASVDAVVAVSCPARWHDPDSRRLHALRRAVARRPGRALLRAAWGARVAPWAPRVEPEDTVTLVARVSPAPLLLVHGVDDAWVGASHATALRAAARPPVALWRLTGAGHAETGARADLGARLAAVLPALARGAAPPDVPAVARA